jgi:hypothetical protein
MAALNSKAPFDVLVMSELSRLGRESIQTMEALGDIKRAEKPGLSCLSVRKWGFGVPSSLAAWLASRLNVWRRGSAGVSGTSIRVRLSLLARELESGDELFDGRAICIEQ